VATVVVAGTFIFEVVLALGRKPVATSPQRAVSVA
jgi:hypothetical protein